MVMKKTCVTNFPVVGAGWSAGTEIIRKRNFLMFVKTKKQKTSMRLLSETLSLPPSHCRISCNTLARHLGCASPARSEWRAGFLSTHGGAASPPPSPLRRIRLEPLSWKVPPRLAQGTNVKRYSQTGFVTNAPVSLLAHRLGPADS